MIHVGDDFHGFRVVRSEHNPHGHIFVFERMGKHLQLEMKTDVYISLALDLHERQRIEDDMEKALCNEYGCKPGHIDGMWGGM